MYAVSVIVSLLFALGCVVYRFKERGGLKPDEPAPLAVWVLSSFVPILQVFTFTTAVIVTLYAIFTFLVSDNEK